MNKAKEKPIIDISDPSDEARDAVNKRLDFHQNIIYAVLVVVGVGFVAVLIAVFALFIDHENYAAEKYKEYIDLVKKKSEEIESLELEVQTPTPKETEPESNATIEPK